MTFVFYAMHAQYKITLLSSLLIALLYCLPAVDAQTRFENFPLDNQLYPRDVNTNISEIPISGKIATNFAEGVRLELFREDNFVDSFEELLPLSAGDSAQFEFTIPITAELANYEIVCYAINSNGTEEIARAKNIVAGDVFLINGQSNAEAGTVMADEDKHPFLRGIRSDSTWNELKFAKPGKWGGRIARRILDKEQIPVSFVNVAVGGKAMKYYLPEYAEETPNNYNLSKDLLRYNGLLGKVRAAFWFQGETDGWEASIESYKEEFLTLANAWLEDYKVEQVFLYQLRFQSCTHPKPFVLEAQRQAAVDHLGVSIMSTSNANHDGCHFTYEGGYQDLADRMYELVNNEFYGGNNFTADAPDFLKANRFEEDQLILQFTSMPTEAVVVGTPWGDFIIDSADVSVIDGYVVGKKIILQLDKAPPTGELFVSYLCHPGDEPNWITNENGVGLLSFYHMPIEAQDSFTISSTSNASFERLSVFPNPVGSTLNIDWSSNNNFDLFQIQLIDLQGRVVLEKTGQLETLNQLNLAYLTNGLYLLRISNGKRYTHRKIIIQQ